MMEKSKLTKELLADSFHELMLHREFEKITIKNITDQAGVIRPTFYYYFQDKYDVLEYIFCRDVVAGANARIEIGQHEAALKYAFTAMEKDQEFYSRAFRVTGQNAFEDVMIHHITESWEKRLMSLSESSYHKNRFLNSRLVATYTAFGMTNVIKEWLLKYRGAATAEDVYEVYNFLIANSVLDLLRSEEKQQP